MSNSKQSDHILGNYQNQFLEAINKKDYQTALKYIIQYVSQYPEQDRNWNHEIINCFLQMKLYHSCLKRIIHFQKVAPFQDNITKFNNQETLVKCYISLFNKVSANDQIQQMEKNLRIYENQSKENSLVEIMETKIKDLKIKIDNLQNISETQRKNEAKMFKSLQEKAEDTNIFKQPDQEVYLIPSQWLNKWKDYSFYNELYEQSDNMEDENEQKKTFDQIYPGPIDASVLVESHVKNQIFDINEASFFQNYVLKKDKAEKHDFEIVSKEIADYFYSIYGGYKIKRLTIINPVTNEVNVELFFQRINFIPIPTISLEQDEETVYTVYISKFANPEQLNQKIKRSLQYIPQISLQIWNRQYYKYWRLSSDLQTNHQNIFKILSEKYTEKEIELNVSEIQIPQDEHVEVINIQNL